MGANTRASQVRARGKIYNGDKAIDVPMARFLSDTENAYSARIVNVIINTTFELSLFSAEHVNPHGISDEKTLVRGIELNMRTTSILFHQRVSYRKIPK